MKERKLKRKIEISFIVVFEHDSLVVLANDSSHAREYLAI